MWIYVIVASFGMLSNAFAEATSKDKNEWTGDHLQIRGNLYGLKKLYGSKPPEAQCDKQEYFAPAYLRFDISEDKDDIITLTPRDNFDPLSNGEIRVFPWGSSWPYGLFTVNLWGTSYSAAVPKEQKIVVAYDTYTINKKDIENIPYVKYGWTYGALAVPYKYQRGYKVVNASPSAQLYLGYERDTNGDTEGPFISAGLSTVDVPTAAGQSNTKQGFSYGLGWIFEVKKSKGLQLIVMLGQDVFGSNSGYQYEGDIWYSMSLGLSLDNQSVK